MGKSTLFNRLVESRQAIVNDEAGTTRDRHYGKVTWNDVEFSVVDTGGWIEGSEDIFESAINRQIEIAIEESDVILFVVDVLNGLTDLDMSVAAILRKVKNRPIIVVSNKTDANEWTYQAAEFYKLGLGDPVPVSGMTGFGTGDLLDMVVSRFAPESKADLIDDSLPKIAVVGRPNVGKSSIINAFIGEERNIVTDIAGTTRDAILTRFNKFGMDCYLVDTAGIRKKSKVSEDVEFYSVMRSIRAIESADVCVLMIDATRGVESQDMSIFSLIQRNRKGLVVCVNKWDLVEGKDSNTLKYFEEDIRSRFAPFTDFPMVFASALTKQRVFKVLESAKAVYDARKRHIPTARLNEFFLPLIENYPPPATKGKYIKIKYVTQLQGPAAPAFVFFANLPQYVKEPYKRFLENKLREQFDFSGTPIQLFIRQK